jgi:ATP-dependent exoDNAse (exonuclease V) beta subunit
MIALADVNARSRILTEFGTTFFVEAAAGTGKTTALVGRIVGLIRSGRGTLARTVAVTFTEKSAGEMKLRLRLEIEKARADAVPEERKRLDRALEELELARIGTIHAFCGDLLSERPIEAGIDPVFTMLDDDDAAALADQAFERWLQRILADPPEGPRRILRRRSGLDSPQELLRIAMQTLREHRDFPQPWRRDPFDRNGASDTLMQTLAEVGALRRNSSWPDDPLARNLAEIARFVREVTRLEAVRGRDYDGLEAELRELARNKRRFRGWDYKGSPKTTFGELTRDEVLARRDGVRADLAAFIAASEADLAPLLHEALQDAIADYELLKSKSGCLDFLDLLIKARDLVRDNAGVRKDLQNRFAHFFVDEFQDTDPLQAEILLLLAADDPNVTDWRAVQPVPGKLFLVGDPKQSIYRFRRADVALYEGVKRRLLAVGAKELHLARSFRAPPSIQTFVNGAFAPAIATDAEASGYVSLEPSRQEITGRPTIIALPVPNPYGDYGKIIDSRVNESLPGAVGAFVGWLINESGWTVEEERRRVPIRPQHIAILFRRFRNFRTDVTRPYVRALEARRIPHVLVGGRSFHDREEILALRNAITAIEWPDDELKVFATLHGPFFALSDEALLGFRQQINGDGTLTFRHLNPMQPVDRSTLDPASVEVADALELLRRLHLGRNSRPIAETVTRLLQALRAHVGIALWQNGEQALANCQRLIDIARHFERGASSFRAFVECIEEEAEHGEVNEAPIVEEGTEGVRVMTVYKAKGLEFPVVILADPTCPATRALPNRHIDAARSLWLEPLCGATPIELREASDLEMRRDRSEAIRVSYVAATRARDLLVVPTCGDGPIEGWLEVLNPVLYPAEDARQNAAPAPGCPAFGQESLLSRGPKGKPPVAGSVRPGLHMSVPDRVPVVWWDPAVLRLEVEELASLRHQRILEMDADGVTAAASQQNYASWKSERDALLAKASQPSLSIQTVTSLVRAAAARAADGTTVAHGPSALPGVDIEIVDRGDLTRPGGRRFGALVHALLASIDLSADVNAVEAAASVQGRLLGATQEEISAAVVTTSRALEHSILRRAASVAHGELRREMPALLALDDGSVIEGVVDLAFREDTSDFAGWTVVDFKTDREFEESSDRYIAQVRVYSTAVAAATSLPTRGIVLVV